MRPVQQEPEPAAGASLMWMRKVQPVWPVPLVGHTFAVATLCPESTRAIAKTPIIILQIKLNLFERSQRTGKNKQARPTSCGQGPPAGRIGL